MKSITSSTTTPTMIFSVSGSRNFTDYEYVKSKLSNYVISHMHVGDCRGFDTLAIRYCTEHHISYTVFYANWEAYGNRAGAIRNRDLIRGSECLLAFPLSNSRGTHSAINMSAILEIPHTVFRYEPPVQIEDPDAIVNT